MTIHFIQLRTANDLAFEALVAEPAAGKSNGRGLVLFPEVYNLNAWIRNVAQEYADDGYLVIAPDLFWRQEPGTYLDYDQPDRARALGDASDVDAIVSDTAITAAFLKDRLGAQAKVASVGFCIGGRFALLAGERGYVDAVSSYYGTQLENYLPRLEKLQVPALLHFAEKDQWVTDATLEKIQAVLAGKPETSIHSYTGTGHGFARKGLPPYVQPSAEAARERTLNFFNQVLA